MSVEILNTERGLQGRREHNSEHLEVPSMRLREKIGHLFGRKAYSETNLTSVIETDFLGNNQNGDGNVAFTRNGVCVAEASQRRGSGGSSGVPLHPHVPSTSAQQEPLLTSQTSVDEQQWMSVAEVLHTKLQHTSNQPRLAKYEFLLPVNLLERIAKDIVRMSCCEPNALNGAVIHINLQRKQDKESFKLGMVDYDSGTAPSFELYLTLIEDKKRWFHLKDLFAPLVPGCLSEHSRKEDIYISLGYQMEKKKLYTHR